MFSAPLLRAVEALRRRNGHAMPRSGHLLHRAVLHALPDEIDVELLPRIRVPLDLRQAVERQSWWQGDRYEHPTTQLLDRWAASASHFFDIGANYGFFALRAVHAGCPEVHAFEPHPGLHARLAAVVERNGLERLHPHHLGLGDEVGRFELHTRAAAQGHGSFGPRTWADDTRIEVDVTTFDQWRAARELGLPSSPSWAIKIDVEGFELRVLRGMAEALAARAFVGMVVELNEQTLRACDTTGEEILALLAATGYVEIDLQEAVDGIRNAFLVPRDAPTAVPPRPGPR